MKNGLVSVLLIAVSLIPCVIFIAGMKEIFGEGAFTAYVSYPLGILIWYYTTKELDKLFTKKSKDE